MDNTPAPRFKTIKISKKDFDMLCSDLYAAKDASSVEFLGRVDRWRKVLFTDKNREGDYGDLQGKFNKKVQVDGRTYPG